MNPDVNRAVVAGGSMPVAIVQALSEGMASSFPNHAVLGRSLRASDPVLSIGVSYQDWTPDERSAEIGGFEPTLARHEVEIQNLVMSNDASTGLSVCAGVGKMIRATLYRNASLRVSLLALSDTSLGSRETVKRLGVVRQRITSGEGTSRGQWIYLGVTRLWLETETMPI